jgi:UDP-N-acetylglucosamine 2-epimerase
MKVVTIVGARPQFIKCAPISRELRQVAVEVLIHTGQHYDNNMSDAFFCELNLPVPDYNLGVGSGSHAVQSGEMLKGIETVLMDEKPDAVVVYGDTNSTLAGALAAAKLHIPVAHIEAGLRSFNRRMPEEINRVVTDHLSTLLFCPSETAVINLSREGISKGVTLVGDVMLDAFLQNIPIAEAHSTVLGRLHVRPGEYFLATVHRAETTDDIGRLRAVLTAFEKLSAVHPVVWPLHPRTRQVLKSHGIDDVSTSALRIIDPVSYLDMLLLEKEAAVILTDSGGVQKEAFWLGVPCVTLREESEWVETVQSGWNTLAGTDSDRIVTAATKPRPLAPRPRNLYGEGHAASIIVQQLLGDPITA